MSVMSVVNYQQRLAIYCVPQTKVCIYFWSVITLLVGYGLIKVIKAALEQRKNSQKSFERSSDLG